MTTLTGRNTRTLVGYVRTLLDYPRWVIEREVDFTDCHLGGDFSPTNSQCASCRFGAACRWLTTHRSVQLADATLDELLLALRTSIDFLRDGSAAARRHNSDCDCDECQWLREATGFVRHYRHRR